MKQPESLTTPRPISTFALPPELRTFALGVVLSGLLWFAVQFCCIHLASLNVFPYNRMILPASGDFADFWLFDLRFLHFHSRAFFDPALGSPFLYPAPDGILYWLVHLVVDPVSRSWAVFAACIGVILFGLTLLLRSRLLSAGLAAGSATLFAAITLISSYPGYFEANRSNVEIFVWLFSGAGVWAFLRNRLWLAAALFGIAGSCKLYPYILLGLLILGRQYKQAVFGVFVGGASLLFSLWALTGDTLYSAQKVAEGLNIFKYTYVLHRRQYEIGLDHSLFGLFKRMVPQMPPVAEAARDLNIYLLIAAVLATALFFMKLPKLPASNRITFLTVATILLPPVSYDYTLLQLYTPWVLLVFLSIRCWRAGVRAPRGLRLAMLCFIVLLSPQNEFILRGEKLEGQIKCLALLALATVSLLDPFEGKTTAAGEVQERFDQDSPVHSFPPPSRPV